MSTKFVLNPQTIYVYVDEEPENNVYWETVRPYITIEKIVPPTEFRGVPIVKSQYKADIIRMEKLLERGGIYLDIDNLTVKPYTHLMDKKFVMFGWKDQHLDDIQKVEAISNSIILSEPNNPFLQYWYDHLHEYMTNGIWAFHAVCAPVKILQHNPDLYADVTLLPWEKYACKFDWTVDPIIFDEKFNHRYLEFIDNLNIVFYQTIVWDKYLKNINPEYMMKHNNIFTMMFKMYMYNIQAKEQWMYDKIWGFYSTGQWTLLENFCRIYLAVCTTVEKQRKEYVSFFLGHSYANQFKLHESKNTYETLLSNVTSNDIKIWTQSNLIRVNELMKVK